MLSRWPMLALLLAALLPLFLRADAAKESDAYFTAGKVIDVKITIDKKEMDSLRREPRKYAKATLESGGKTYKDVGIHVKGAAGSYRGIDDRPCLTFNMDKFGVEQRFHGMDKWHVSNSVQDGTWLHELICGELFRAAGVPASRVGHVTMTLNGRRLGMFYLKEGYDKHFRRRYFANPDGNLYDGGFLREIDQPLQLLYTKADVKNHADLKALVKACQERNEAERFRKLDKLLEMDRFISYMCLETICWDWDGYPMKRNNYRIYHDPKKDKITFFPSGMDQMFGDTGGSIFPHMEGMIARGVLETKEGRSRYFARMKEIMDKIFKPDALSKRLDELEKAITPALTAVDPGAGRDYKNRVNGLRNAIKERAKRVEEQLKRAK
jgi:spore coat protein H